MSYWTFTDIFEESGTVPNPFHGGFGMINFQGLRKPSFYAYQFLNRLGDEELTSNDAESWTTRSKNDVQILLWNFTPPITKESDQVFYKKDLPAKNFGKVNVKISDIPAGDYQMNVYQIGYQVNDVYTNYLKIGAPQNLKREQVKELNDKNNGQSQENLRMSIKPKQPFVKTIQLRENDVFLVTLNRLASQTRE
jgi:xylan 1,4-beta-xylosidase